jgi:hypothetical protein
MIIPGATNITHVAASAGNTFAPATAALEPSVVEAMEEYRRAKRYRDEAVTVGVAIGAAVGLLLLASRR